MKYKKHRMHHKNQTNESDDELFSDDEDDASKQSSNESITDKIKSIECISNTENLDLNLPSAIIAPPQTDIPNNVFLSEGSVNQTSNKYYNFVKNNDMNNKCHYNNSIVQAQLKTTNHANMPTTYNNEQNKYNFQINSQLNANVSYSSSFNQHDNNNNKIYSMKTMKPYESYYARDYNEDWNEAQNRNNYGNYSLTNPAVNSNQFNNSQNEYFEPNNQYHQSYNNTYHQSNQQYIMQSNELLNSNSPFNYDQSLIYQKL